MTDLEQRLRAEFDRQASSAPSAAATERFALDLTGSHRRLRRRAWLIPAVAALVLIVPILTVLAIHRHKTAQSLGSSNPEDLVGVHWILTGSVDSDGTHHDQTGKQELWFDGKGNVSFDVECNNDAFGAVELKAGTMIIGQINSTQVGCKYVGPASSAPPPEPMDLLRHDTTSDSFRWSLVDRKLTITASDGRKLIFTGPPVSTKSLVGVEWLLTQEISADGTTHAAPTGRDEQTLRFDGNGGISFNWNCNYASGKVSIGNGSLKPSNVVMTAIGCGSGDNSMSLLDGSTTLTWQLTGNLLTIGGPDGRKLIFTVRPSIYPLDYPGSANVTVTQGTIGTGAYRVSYVKDSTNRVYVFLEARDAPGGYWTQLESGTAVGWTGPQPKPDVGCETAPIAGGRYLIGVATSKASRVIVSSGDTVKLYPLPNTGGLQAYAGFIGSAANGSTVSVYDQAGGSLGTPCHITS